MSSCNYCAIVIFVISTKMLVVSSQAYCPDNTYIPSNGSRKPSDFHLLYMDGAVLRYSCDNTYMLEPHIDVQVCKNGTWQPQQTPECQKICDDLESIPSGHHVPWQEQYPAGSNVTYTCEDGTLLVGEVTRTCLPDGTWTGNPPHCQPASPPVDHLYCPKPPNIDNGAAVCCLGAGSSLHPFDYCCPPNNKVQFECYLGYTLVGVPQWTCGDDGEWLNPQIPTCDNDEQVVSPRLDPPPLSVEMMHTVVGVAVGVLGLLLIVIILAFCKPRLRDIKRRWRDLREDENELIVNGQRVVLPTYEEATSGPDYRWCDSLNLIPSSSLNALSSRLALSSQTEDITRPPESNVTVDDLIVLPTSPSFNSNFNFQPDLQLRRYSGPIINGGHEDEATLSTGGVTITEFLRENPCTSRDTVDVVGFDDDFVPTRDFSHQRVPPASSPTSLASNERVSTPLLASSGSSKQVAPPTDVDARGDEAAGEADAWASGADKIECDQQPGVDGLTATDYRTNLKDHVVAQADDIPIDVDSLEHSIEPPRQNEFTAIDDLQPSTNTDQRMDKCPRFTPHSDSTSV